MISIKVEKPRYFRQKVFGLIGSKQAYPMLLKTRFGIHTFGLGFPIDVAVLDRENRVVGLRSNLSPCRIFFWNILYNIVLELPAGTIQTKKILIGDKVDLDFI